MAHMLGKTYFIHNVVYEVMHVLHVAIAWGYSHAQVICGATMRVEKLLMNCQ